MPTDTPRTVAGRYDLEQRLGVGGAGAVWRARDRTLDRSVAVKLIDIPDHLSEEERDRARARVGREARAAARLDHPGVVTVFDIVEDGDDLAIVMDLVDAPTVAELVAREGPLDDRRAAAIGAGVLEVLRVAHDAGVVHRDVKPSNVLVLDGRVKLTDFGIATVAGETELTRTGTALGSPGYLAPEQAEGDDAGPPADLWGLGTVLYFALEGAPPFDRGRALATVRAVVGEPPRQMTSGSALQPIVLELLTKDPAQRPDPEAVARRLRAVGRGPRPDADPDATVVMPVAGSGRGTGPGPTSVEETAETSRHPAAGSRRTSGLVGALLALLGIAVVAGVAWLWIGASGGEPGADGPGPQAQQDPAAPGETTPATSAPDEVGTTAGDDTAAPEGTDPSPTPTTSPTSGATPAGEAIGGGTAEVPEDWTVYDGATYDVSHPPTWEVRPDTGPRVDLTDPDTGSYLRLDWTDQPEDDPVADWERQSEAFAERHADYEEIRIEPVEYRGHDAAIWEYTYTAAGQRFHAVNVGLTTGECGYALNLQSPAELWDDLGALIGPFSASFQPQGC